MLSSFQAIVWMDAGIQNKIFVGGLAAVTSNESLTQYLSQYGPVECTVMMDRLTGRSRGFGFATFASPESATAVLSVPHSIDGKAVECRACLPKEARGGGLPSGTGLEPQAIVQPALQGWAPQNNGALGNFGLPPGGIPRGGSSRPLEHKIFVGGLAPTTTSESLNAYFSQFGQSDSIVMMDRNTGRSRGFGFCTFAAEEQAAAVLRAGTPNAARDAVEHVVDGKVVSVKVCEAKFDGGQATSPVPPALGTAAPGLPSQVPALAIGTAPAAGLEGLQDALGSLGSAISALAPAAAPGQVPPALPRAHSYAQLHGLQNTGSRIFVGGLPQTCDDSKLHTFFSRFGTLTDAKVMMDRATGRSRGFGYVSFVDPVSTDAAIANAGQNIIDEKWVEVKRCEEKGSPKLPARPPAPLAGRVGFQPDLAAAASFQPGLAPAVSFQPDLAAATATPAFQQELVAAAASQALAAPGLAAVTGYQQPDLTAAGVGLQHPVVLQQPVAMPQPVALQQPVGLAAPPIDLGYQQLAGLTGIGAGAATTTALPQVSALASVSSPLPQPALVPGTAAVATPGALDLSALASVAAQLPALVQGSAGATPGLGLGDSGAAAAGGAKLLESISSLLQTAAQLQAASAPVAVTAPAPSVANNNRFSPY